MIMIMIIIMREGEVLLRGVGTSTARGGASFKCLFGVFSLVPCRVASGERKGGLATMITPNIRTRFWMSEGLTLGRLVQTPFLGPP